MQDVVVYIVLAMAVFYFARKAYMNFSGKRTGCGGCSGCNQGGSCPSEDGSK